MSGLQRIYRPNPFAFPGIAPGFDPTHPAAQNVSPFGYSGSFIAAGSNFVNLLNGKPGTLAHSLTPSSLVRRSGPGIIFAGTGAAGQEIDFVNSGTPTTATMAVIFDSATGFGGSSQSLVQATNSSLYYLGSSGGVIMFLAGNVVSGITITTGGVFFVAASAKSAARVNFVVANLTTGSVQTASIGTASTLGASSLISIGNNGAGNAYSAPLTTAYMSAAMLSTAFLSIPQLLAWAADPWAFWYPRTLTDTIFDGLKAPSAAAAFKPAWAVGRNFINEGVAT